MDKRLQARASKPAKELVSWQWLVETDNKPRDQVEEEHPAAVHVPRTMMCRLTTMANRGPEGSSGGRTLGKFGDKTSRHVRLVLKTSCAVQLRSAMVWFDVEHSRSLMQGACEAKVDENWRSILEG